MPMTEKQMQAAREFNLAEIKANREQTAARGIIPAPDDMKSMGSFADDNPQAHDANRNAEPDGE